MRISQTLCDFFTFDSNPKIRPLRRLFFDLRFYQGIIVIIHEVKKQESGVKIIQKLY